MNEGTENPLKLLDAEGQWHVFDVEGLDVSTRFLRVLATQSEQVWIVLGGGEGVVVMSTGGTPADPSDDDVRFLNQGEGNGRRQHVRLTTETDAQTLTEVEARGRDRSHPAQPMSSSPMLTPTSTWQVDSRDGCSDA